MEKSVYAVVTAAGSGTRLGYTKPKALVELKGKTIVERAVETLLKIPAITMIVVTAPAETEHYQEFANLFQRVAQVKVVPGGKTRQASVYQGLQAIETLLEKKSGKHQKAGEPTNQDSVKVLIHDAARCLTPRKVICKILEKLEDGEHAVIPVVPVVDTLIHYETNENENAYVTDYASRETLKAVQTPQAFDYPLILQAHELAARNNGAEFTDDASLMRLLGKKVALVAGSEESLKITTPLDLKIAEMILGKREMK